MRECRMGAEHENSKKSIIQRKNAYRKRQFFNEEGYWIIMQLREDYSQASEWRMTYTMRWTDLTSLRG